MKLLFIFTLFVMFQYSNQVYSKESRAITFKDKSGKEINSDKTKNGFYKLIWLIKKDDKNREFELQFSNQKDFEKSKTIYRGPNEAEFISGLKEGVYYYRVRDVKNKSEWSRPLKLTVEYDSLEKAWGLFTTGAVVFIAIVLFVIIGNRKSNL